MLGSKEVYENIFRMQRLFVDNTDEAKIRNSIIAQIGVGGIGGYIFEGLIRNGFSNIRLAEKDSYEINNYRQLYMTTETIGSQKAEVAKSRALEINPYTDIQIFDKLSGSNARVFFQNATVIVQYLRTRVWDNSLLCPKKSNGFAVAFLHGCDSLGKIELLNKPFRKAIPCIFTITQIKQLYH